MPLYDGVNEIGTHWGLVQNSLTVSAQGSSVDMSNDKESTTLAVNALLSTVANVTSAQIQAEEWSGLTNGSGNGGTTWTVIPGIAPGTSMVLTVTATTAAANLQQKTAGFRSQRYARVNAITVTGASTATGFQGVAALLIAQKENVPTDAPNSAGVPVGSDRWPSS